MHRRRQPGRFTGIIWARKKQVYYVASLAEDALRHHAADLHMLRSAAQQDAIAKLNKLLGGSQ